MRARSSRIFLTRNQWRTQVGSGAAATPADGCKFIKRVEGYEYKWIGVCFMYSITNRRYITGW